VKICTVDDYHRVRLPNVKPRTQFAYEQDADGSIRLVPAKLAAAKRGRVTNVDPLPRNVLKKLYEEREEDEEAIDRFIAAQPKGPE
jgi:hypothetical protein